MRRLSFAAFGPLETFGDTLRLYGIVAESQEGKEVIFGINLLSFRTDVRNPYPAVVLYYAVS
jgi:hypothetical protein